MVNAAGTMASTCCTRRVEVSPSAHYHMGGVKVDRDGRCNVEGLFVAGEDAGGVHGANRLGGNGVADSIVFGPALATPWLRHRRRPLCVARPARFASCAQMDETAVADEGANPFALRGQLEEVMWLKVGVVRNGSDLRTALAALQDLKNHVDVVEGSGGAIYNAKWNEGLNLANMTVVAEMIATRALLREESRGADYRQDFPNPDPKWFQNICMAAHNGGLRAWLVPVQFTRLKPS